MTESDSYAPEAAQPNFRSLGLSDRIVSNVEKLGFLHPTPIQLSAIPACVSGRDVIGLAQTGTGKTLAFGLPTIERLLGAPNSMALIVAPTRELAMQIEQSLGKVASQMGLRTALLIGGAPMHSQVGRLRSNPHIVVATPGRLLDHMGQRTIKLGNVAVFVLDEADRMLDMGFLPSIRKISAAIPADRQTLLFSATMPKEIRALTQDLQRDPIQIDVAQSGETPGLVSQEMHYVEHENKIAFLGDLLQSEAGTVLVFARTRHGAHKVAKQVRLMGHSAAELHSDRTPAQRRSALEGFKSGEHRVLVATDIAARGIDVKQIALVVNFDLPDQPEDYVHRIGRTGRAGQTGRAVTIATPQQVAEVRRIERLVGGPGTASMGKDEPSSARPQTPRRQPRQNEPRPVLEAPVGGKRFSARPSGGRRFPTSR